MYYNWEVNKIENEELKQMLQRESIKRSPLVISLHLEDYGNVRMPYYETISDFLRQGAIEGRFRFLSMKEYVKTLMT